eukprot:366518-Chlamydomonas_euryale.AAC.8
MASEGGRVGRREAEEYGRAEGRLPKKAFKGGVWGVAQTGPEALKLEKAVQPYDRTHVPPPPMPAGCPGRPDG